MQTIANTVLISVHPMSCLIMSLLSEYNKNVIYRLFAVAEAFTSYRMCIAYPILYEHCNVPCGVVCQPTSHIIKSQENHAVASYNKIIYFLHLLYRSTASMFISLLTQTEKIKNYTTNSLLVY